MSAGAEYLFPRSRRGKVKPCPHCRRRNHTILITLAVLLGLLAGTMLAVTGKTPSYPVAGTAQLASYRETPGARMLDAAETRAGDWYSYGSAGPSYFDCSGLVYWSAGRTGLRNWPRTTYGLIAAAASGRLSYTSHPQRGDLAFFGSGHVEFVTVWYHMTFGAQKSGTRVGWHSWDGWWHPTFYLHINW